MTRRSRRLLLVYFLALCSVLLPALATVMAAREIAVREYRARIQTVSADILRRAERISVQVQDAFGEVGRSPNGVVCSEPHLDLMRKAVVKFNMLIDVGASRGNMLLCSSFGHRPFDLGPPTYTSGPGYQVRVATRHPLHPNATVLAVTDPRAGSTALIHEDSILEVSPAHADLSIGIFAWSQQHLVAGRGHIDARWLRGGPAPQQRSLAAAEGYLATVERSGRYDYAVVVAAPLARVDAATSGFALLLAPLGACIALALLYIVLQFSRRQASMPAAIRLAIARREFSMAYQPIVDLRTRAIVGAEALVRWRGEDGEMVRPDLFIPVAESHHLITQVTDCVLSLIEVEAGPLLRAADPFYLTVNLSADDLLDSQLPTRLQSWAARLGAAPGRIHAEATERVFLDHETVRGNLKALRAQGIPTSVDDFGTGYSSLSYLAHLDLDYLKIDKTFIDTIGTHSVTSNVVAHIIEMAKSLGLQMIAEGVETQAQADYLLAHGVQYAQGWLFSKAVGIDELRSRVRANRAERLGGPGTSGAAAA